MNRWQEVKVYLMVLLSDRKFFDQFERNEDGSCVKFLPPSLVREFMNRKIEPDKWMKHVKTYLTNAQGHLVASKRLIFRIDCQQFITYTDPARQLTVMVSVNHLYVLI